MRRRPAPSTFPPRESAVRHCLPAYAGEVNLGVRHSRGRHASHPLSKSTRVEQAAHAVCWLCARVERVGARGHEASRCYLPGPSIMLDMLNMLSLLSRAIPT